jgi:hypothetical protein
VPLYLLDPATGQDRLLGSYKVLSLLGCGGIDLAPLRTRTAARASSRRLAPRPPISSPSVRASGEAIYDASGHESLVSAYVNPPRPMIDVKTK